MFLKVPSAPSFLKITNPSLDSLTLEWGPPTHPNGVLTGYTLKFQPSKYTEFLIYTSTATLNLELLSTRSLYVGRRITSTFQVRANCIKSTHPFF